MHNLLLTEATGKALGFWAFFWLMVVGGSIYTLPPTGLEYIHNFHFVSAYFMIFALVGGYYYRVDRVLSHHVKLSRQLSYIIPYSILIAGGSLFIETTFPVGSIAFENILVSKFYFPLFRSEILITKFFDIVFQQTFIYGILKKLKELGVSDRRAFGLFSVSFFFIHLPLVFNMRWTALYFIIPSLGAGMMFSYLILKFRYGLFYSFALHFMFYFLISLYLRL